MFESQVQCISSRFRDDTIVLMMFRHETKMFRHEVLGYWGCRCYFMRRNIGMRQFGSSKVCNEYNYMTI